MSALDAARDTKQFDDQPLPRNYSALVAAGAVINQGALVALDGGYLVPVTAATGLVALGRARESVDNTDGDDGDVRCEVEPGCFKWANATGGDAVGQAQVGGAVYGDDDQTVTKTSGGRSKVGIAYQVDDDGVWVISGLGLGL